MVDFYLKHTRLIQFLRQLVQLLWLMRCYPRKFRMLASLIESFDCIRPPLRIWLLSVPLVISVICITHCRTIKINMSPGLEFKLESLSLPYGISYWRCGSPVPSPNIDNYSNLVSAVNASNLDITFLSHNSTTYLPALRLITQLTGPGVHCVFSFFLSAHTRQKTTVSLCFITWDRNRSNSLT